MAFNCKQFKLIIEDTLLSFSPPLAKNNAVNLLLGTAAVESNFGTYVRQIKGPAVSVFQIEPFTERDMWENYIVHKQDIKNQLSRIYHATGPDPERLVTDLGLAIVMARLYYLRKPSMLPQADDLIGLAEYWKREYNTYKGKGTVEKFIEKWRQYVDCVRFEQPARRNYPRTG